MVFSLIKRSEYLSKISPFMDKPIVKAIVDLRRVGKSVFIRQLMDSLVSAGVSAQNILYVDMESLRFDFSRTYLDLNRYVEKQIAGIKWNRSYFIVPIVMI